MPQAPSLKVKRINTVNKFTERIQYIYIYIYILYIFKHLQTDNYVDRQMNKSLLICSTMTRLSFASCGSFVDSETVS